MSTHLSFFRKNASTHATKNFFFQNFRFWKKVPKKNSIYLTNFIKFYIKNWNKNILNNVFNIRYFFTFNIVKRIPMRELTHFFDNYIIIKR